MFFSIGLVSAAITLCNPRDPNACPTGYVCCKTISQELPAPGFTCQLKGSSYCLSSELGLSAPEYLFSPVPTPVPNTQGSNTAADSNGSNSDNMLSKNSASLASFFLTLPAVLFLLQ